MLVRLLQPRAEGARVETIRLNVGEHGEQRIDARFDRTLAQQLGAEAVNRVHVRLFERFERLLEPPADVVVRRSGALVLERFAQPQLQLARRFLRERDGDDLDHRRAPRREDAQDPVHELRRLAGASRRLDDQRVVEILGNRPPRLSVTSHCHECRPSCLSCPPDPTSM
jgi:hypothetical protein